MRLEGGNLHAAMQPMDELPGKVNYFLGNDRAKWRTDIPTYRRVRSEGVYPGIDLVYYGNQQDLEYDFVVAPGGDPSAIRMAFSGADRVTLDPRGDLLIHTGRAELRQAKPVLYQEIAGRRRRIDGEYRLLPDGGPGAGGQEPGAGKGSGFRPGTHRRWVAGSGAGGSLAAPKPASAPHSALRTPHPSRPTPPTPCRLVSFRVGDYDPTRPLMIDPTLQYSTYFGGTSDELADAITVDASGSAYITGSAGEITTVNAYQAGPQGAGDGFVTKLSPDGSAIVFSTYLGGTDLDAATGVALDSHGNICISGYTFSTDFPTQKPIQAASSSAENAFLTKLSPAGNALLWSTYIGTSDDTLGLAVAVDGLDNTVLAGWYGNTAFGEFRRAGRKGQRGGDRPRVHPVAGVSRRAQLRAGGSGGRAGQRLRDRVRGERVRHHAQRLPEHDKIVPNVFRYKAQPRRHPCLQHLLWRQRRLRRSWNKTTNEVRGKKKKKILLINYLRIMGI